MNNNCILVEFTPAEIMEAANAGVMRQVENIKGGAQAAYGSGNKMDWQLAIEGTLGERAVAKALNWYCPGKGIKCDADLVDPDGKPVDVRASMHDGASLVIHDRDPNDRKFILVTGRYGKYLVRGWVWPAQAKLQKYWKDPTGNGRSAYFVPQRDLEPIRSLKE
jgi:hypothetical protein